MTFLDIKEQRAGNRIFALSDCFIGGGLAIHRGGIQTIFIHGQVAVAEDARRIGIGFQLLHDEVVIFTGFHINPILAHRHASVLEPCIVLFLFGLDPGDFLTSTFQSQLSKGIAGTGARRRTQYLNLGGRQSRVNLVPGLVGVIDQGTALGVIGVRYLFGQRQEDLLAGQRQGGLGFFGLGHDDTIKADLDLDNVLHPSFLTSVIFRLLHLARGIGNVWKFGSNTPTEKLDATPGPGRLDLGCFELTALAKLFSHCSGERVNRGGAGDSDGVTAAASGLDDACQLKSGCKQTDDKRINFHK